jgi:hypothetical protein
VYSLHYYSTFQLEAEKYGFSWPNPKYPSYWTNSIGPTKNAVEAKEIYNEMFKLCLAKGRLYFGGFSDMSLKNIVKYTKYKDMDTWMAVDRVKRVATIGPDVRGAHKILVEEYFNNLMAL